MTYTTLIARSIILTAIFASATRAMVSEKEDVTASGNAPHYAWKPIRALLAASKEDGKPDNMIIGPDLKPMPSDESMQAYWERINNAPVKTEKAATVIFSAEKINTLKAELKDKNCSLTDAEIELLLTSEITTVISPRQWSAWDIYLKIGNITFSFCRYGETHGLVTGLVERTVGAKLHYLTDAEEPFLFKIALSRLQAPSEFLDEVNRTISLDRLEERQVEIKRRNAALMGIDFDRVS